MQQFDCLLQLSSLELQTEIQKTLDDNPLLDQDDNLGEITVLDPDASRVFWISLSGGERRRVEIARALANQPEFILLDEPFAGVDPISVVDIQSIIRQLTERGIGVLITDHNVRETLGICDRAYVMGDGEVLAEGKPAQILENKVVRKIYLGDDFKL